MRPAVFFRSPHKTVVSKVTENRVIPEDIFSGFFVLSKGPLKLKFSNAKAKLDSETINNLKDLFTELGATGVSVKASSVTFAIAP